MTNEYLVSQQQALSTDTLVELYEFDASTLTTAEGVQNSGPAYLWTPGVPTVTYTGTVQAGSNPNYIVLGMPIPARGVPQEGFWFTVTTAPASHGSQGTGAIGCAVTAYDNYLGTGNLGIGVNLPFTPAVGSAWTLYGPGYVSFGGAVYAPFPVVVTGYERTGQGKLARPKLTIDNTILLPGTTLSLADALVFEFSDILGAKITRLRTFAECLDGGSFADPTAVFDPDIFYIDRKSSQTKAAIEFELTTDFEQIGLRLPRRQILRDACTHSYRRYVPGAGAFSYGTCPYTGGGFFDPGNNPVADPNLDVCGKRFSSCQTRFGAAPLPTRAFPGVALVNS